MDGRPKCCLAGLLVALVLAAALAAGCGAPPATMELIAVAENALIDAAALARSRHGDDIKRIDAQAAALDAAFDADVRLVEAGKIASAAGEPVQLSAKWVISARKGYAAARDALAQQRLRLAAEQAVTSDNFAAAAEALEMARQLILQHYALTERTKLALGSLGRRLIRER